MARFRRYDKIHGNHLDEIERKIDLLRIDMNAAMRTLTPFRAHYDAICALDRHLAEAINLLHDRPPDWRDESEIVSITQR